jgi:copper(I)-binding protein
MKYLGIFLGVTWAVAAHAAPVEVSGAWARATLPHQNEGVAYLTLRSAGGDTLTGVDSPQAGMAMLHQTTQAGGMSSMSDVDSVALPPGQAVALAPGGTHIMLMDLKQPLKPGDTLHLTLSFAHGGKQDVAVPVRPVGASGPDTQ